METLNTNLLYIYKDGWFKIFLLCGICDRFSLCLVNKLFRKIIADNKLLHLEIFCVNPSYFCEGNWESPESNPGNFLDFREVLQEVKSYKLNYLTAKELLELCSNPPLNPMINALELSGLEMDNISQLLLEKALNSLNITLFSLANGLKIPSNFSEICSRISTLRHLNITNYLINSFLDLSTAPFVKIYFDRVECKSGTYIRMPRCLKKFYLHCYEVEDESSSNHDTKFQMEHCKELYQL
jgi:hypothetical protein